MTRYTGRGYDHHPWEPFPLYKPHTRKQKIRFKLITLRWKLIRPFVTKD